MSDKKRLPGVEARIITAPPMAPVSKAETSVQLSSQEETVRSEWLEPPYDMRGFRSYVTHSSVLPQCIRAYKNNIAGFGIGIRYKGDYNDSNKEAAAEFEWAKEIIDLLNMDMDTKEVFEDLLDARETFGISYLEAIRNNAGEVAGIEFIKDTHTIRKTIPLPPYIEVDYPFKDRIERRSKKFCKYKQTIGQQTVYFKEIGDPRIMDNRNGNYLKDGETLAIEHQANEIFEFAIGTEPYGEVRWIGQILGIDGSRKAEALNNRYFEEGRHTPLLILIKGGTLTPESQKNLQTYMGDIKGEKGQHAFILLQAEGADNQAAFETEKQPEIQVVPLANILQKDELFQDYLDNNRRRVQSAFQLPDLYTGYTTDFNRATAQTAMEVTEKQVFQPERRSIAWAINNKLLSGYNFKYVECYFKEPDITNPDDLYKILTVGNNAGGLTPNKAKQIIYQAMGETSDDYLDEWGDIPLALSRQQTGYSNTVVQPAVVAQLESQIKKAASANDDAIVAVMKEVRSLLLDIQKGA